MAKRKKKINVDEIRIREDAVCMFRRFMNIKASAAQMRQYCLGYPSGNSKASMAQDYATRQHTFTEELVEHFEEEFGTNDKYYKPKTTKKKPAKKVSAVKNPRSRLKVVG